MSLNEYHFVTNWRVTGTLAELHKIFLDPTTLPRWWPSVYLEANELAPGDLSGVGKKIELFTKGFLPYTLRWRFVVTEVRDDGMALAASGDFIGRGVWTFRQHGPFVDIEYDWRISAEKPLLRRLSPLLKPIFAANHEWAMRQGLHSLRLELARTRAQTPEARARIPAPPPPTTMSPWPWLAGFAAAAGGVVLAIRAIRSST